MPEDTLDIPLVTTETRPPDSSIQIEENKREQHLAYRVTEVQVPQEYGGKFDALKDISKGFWLPEAFLDHWQEQHQPNAYALGLTNHQVSEDLVNRCGLKDWREGFRELGLQYVGEERKLRNVINNVKYLKLATDNTVVYFVPSELFTHPNADYTRREMLYFLKHPDKAKNAYFVFI